MMEFLDTLFNYEYFGPVLFAIIAILIIIFFIVLFFGKKDEKERKLEETRRLELANVNAFKEEPTEQKAEVEHVEMPVFETPEVNEEVYSLESFINLSENENPGLVTEPTEVELVEEQEELSNKDTEPVLTPISEMPLITETEINMPIQEVKVVDEVTEDLPFRIEPSIPTNIPKYNFEELANSISKELEEIEKMSYKAIEKEEVKEEPKLELEESRVEITPIKEIQKKGAMPIFSSVFVPKTNEDNEVKVVPEVEEADEIIVSEEKTDDISENYINTESVNENLNEEAKIDFSKLKSETPTIVKPAVELPKHVELPKKAAETIKSETVLPDFSGIEGESYEIK